MASKSTPRERIYKNALFVLGVALAGSIFLNINQDMDNRDLTNKLQLVVSAARELELKQEYQQTRGAELNNDAYRSSLQARYDSIAAMSGSSPVQMQQQTPAQLPANGAYPQQPGLSSSPSTVNPYSTGSEAVIGGQASPYTQGSQSGGFDDMNKMGQKR